MATHHPETYRSIAALRDMDATTLGELGQTFVVTEAAADEWSWALRDFELEEGGHTTRVEVSSVERFIRKKVQHRYRDSCMQQIEAAKQGLAVFFPDACFARVREFFSIAEMHAILTVERTVNVPEWRAHTDYEGCVDGDEDIGWLWSVVGPMDGEGRTAIMRWWAATAVPAGGFAVFPERFKVARAADPGSFPVAHTCSWTLDLPRYSSYIELHDKLMRAVVEGGFHLA